MKKLIAAYLAGILSVLGYALHRGAEDIIQLGLKLEAVQTDYVFTARPVESLDESGVAEVLAAVPTKKGKR
jgi:hypothetical protein